MQNLPIICQSLSSPGRQHGAGRFPLFHHICISAILFLHELMFCFFISNVFFLFKGPLWLIYIYDFGEDDSTAETTATATATELAPVAAGTFLIF